MLVDAVLNTLGVHSSTTATRMITGTLLGAVLPFFVVAPLQEAVQQLRLRFSFIGGSLHARKTK